MNYLKYNNKDIIELETLKIENTNLKKEISNLEDTLNIKPPTEDYIMAKVLIRNLHNFYNEIILYCDTTKVKEGNAVINEEGLIGIVKEIDNNKVYVNLLTSDYNISIKINDTYGTLNNNKITMLNKYSTININDPVYTSGLTLIPENIYIGRVKEVINNDINTEAIITLLDNDNLNYVAILTGEI